MYEKLPLVRTLPPPVLRLIQSLVLILTQCDHELVPSFVKLLGNLGLLELKFRTLNLPICLVQNIDHYFDPSRGSLVLELPRKQLDSND